MKMNYKFISLLIILFFISISLVSAASDNNDTVMLDENTDGDLSIDNSQADNEIININDTDEPVSTATGTFTELQQIIWGAKAGDTIVLDKDYELDSALVRQHIIIDRTLTIDGAGHTINGKDTKRIFYVEPGAPNTVLTNINFVNGYHAESGGAILWRGADGTITNCNFTHNIVNKIGGAIYWDEENGVISNCIFTDNKAGVNKISEYQSGGAIYWAKDNGKVYNNQFINNFALTNGGAITWKGTNGNVSNNIFTDNLGKESGGAIYWDGPSGLIDNNTFTSNTGELSGGAIYYEADGGVASNNKFIKNTAKTNAGAIRWKGNGGTVSDNYFSENTASLTGGAIYWEGTKGILSNNQFIKNTADVSAGAVLWNGNSGTVSGNTFTDSSATNYGGAIYFKGNYSTLSNNQFKNNKASKSGGALYWEGINGQVKNNVFEDSSSQSGSGGAIRWDAASGTLTGNTFKNSNAKSGGAIYWEGKDGKLIQNTFTKSTASDAGGAVYWNSNNAEITGNSFDGSTSTNNYGGAIYFNGDSSKINNNNFTNNKAAKSGGALYYNGASNTASSNIFTDNTAQSGSGGAVSWNGASATLTKNQFEGNSASKGTAVYGEGNNAKVTENTFINDVEGDGCLRWEGSAEIKDNIYVSHSRVTTLTLDELETYYGATPKLTAKLLDSSSKGLADKTISITLNGQTKTGKTNSNGQVTIDFDSLELGNYNATAKFAGDSDYDEQTDKSTVSVKSTIESSDLTAEIGNVKYNATFLDSNGKPLAKGEYVSFTIDNDNYRAQVGNNGVATLDVDKGVGDYTVTNINTATGETSTNKIKITKLSTQITMKDVEVYYGGSQKLVAILTDSNSKPLANKNITIKFNNKNTVLTTNEKGQVSLDIKDLDEGEYQATATFAGDNDYNKNTATATVTAKSTIESEDLTTTYGNVKYNATFLDSNGKPLAKGESVSFTINNNIYNATVEDNGVATITLKESAGDYKVNILNTKTGETTTNKIKINKASPNLNAVAKDIEEGVDAVFDITSDSQSGLVILNINKVDYNATLEKGKTSISVPNLTAGKYPYSVKYVGDANYTEQSVTGDLNVKSDDVIISAPDVTKYFNGPERLTVTLTDKAGTPLKDKVVFITINSRAYNRTTDENGIASMALGLPSKNYTADIVFKGDDEYKAVNTTCNVEIKSTVIGKDITKVEKAKVPYIATFLDSNGKPLAKGTEIQFNINGVFYKRVIGDNGEGQLNINLVPGTYTITAINTQTGENAANTVIIKPRIINNNDVTKYFKNDTQYYVTVLDDNGSPVKANTTVKFNINGVFYERQTNENGTARMNINLPEGEYTITAEYNNCKASNKIKVLPILSAKDITMKYRDGTKFEAKLLNGSGKLYANQNITFNINGVFYTRSTDENGTARLNINLMAGEYIITSSYNGANIANKVTIRA